MAKLDGVQDVKMDFSKKTATIKTSKKLSAKDVEKALEGSRYKVSEFRPKATKIY